MQLAYYRITALGMPGGQLSQPMLLGPNKGLDSMLGAYAELQRQSEGTSFVAGKRPSIVIYVNAAVCSLVEPRTGHDV
ncbi:hypothetical protein N7507_002867 [Penicillium longicatenatum]|nr:hypothetical protein N7507_002867 [Penicillium longicatenatum]